MCRRNRRRRAAAAALASLVALLTVACQGDGKPPRGVPWAGDFESGSLSQWKNRTSGPGVQRVAGDRIRVVRAPVIQGRYAARFEVRPGDRWRDSSGNRAELQHWTGEAEGDRRQYTWGTMFARDYPSTRRGFQIVTQWHANRAGTQPPIYLFASGDEIGLKVVPTTRSGEPKASRTLWRAPMARGTWHRFRLRVTWSASARTGRVTLWHDNRMVVRGARVQTLIPDTVNYVKQGLYRSDDIRGVGVVYHDGMRATRI